MRPGTPGFVGLRLKEGREARGLTASSLASMLEVTRQHVTRMEAEDATPSPEIMKKICEKLELPHHFFLRAVRDFPGETIFYRSMSSATKIARIKAEQRLKWLREIVLYLQEYVNFPALKFPEFDLPAVPSKISDEMIEDIACEVRRFWGLGNNPIVNLVGLLEQHCTIISRDYMDAQTLDALSLWGSVEGIPYIVLNADKQSAIRSRTDAAHELGHLILHRKIKRNQLSKAEEFKLIEDQAFRFARAFLLPSDSFAEDVYALSLDALRALQPKWKISLGMKIKRSEDLGLINGEQAKRLWINLNRRGWKFHEPFDDELEIEQPTILSTAFSLLQEEMVQSVNDILWEIPYGPWDIQELSGLPKGFLVASQSTISVTTKSLGDEARDDQPQQPEGKVLPFFMAPERSS